MDARVDDDGYEIDGCTYDDDDDDNDTTAALPVAAFAAITAAAAADVLVPLEDRDKDDGDDAALVRLCDCACC